MNTQIRAFRQLWSDCIEIGIRRKGDKIEKGILTFEECSPNCHIPPASVLSITEAQALIDSLWDCGLRPTEGAGSAGSLSATKYHLEDMRALVFKGQ